MKSGLCILWMVCVTVLSGFAQQTYPKLREICTDEADIMSLEEFQSLKEKLKHFENDTSHQIVVLTINNLGDDTIENYARQVFETNQLGQLGDDNGLLILFSAEDREVRIEVGYGLEPIITDAGSSRLIRDIMIPEFKHFRYFEGIDLAIDEIINIISDPLYAQEFIDTEEQTEEVSSNSFWGSLIFIVLVGAFLSIFFLVGVHILTKGFKDLVNLYRGLISGNIGLISFPFHIMGVFFILLFGSVFSFFPLLGFFILITQFVFGVDVNTMMNGILNSGYITIRSVMFLLGMFLVGLPLFLAILIVKRYDTAFKLSFLKSNKIFIKKNLLFFKGSSSSSGSWTYGSSASRSSGYSRSSSRSSSSGFSGGGGRSGGGGASGKW